MSSSKVYIPSVVDETEVLDHAGELESRDTMFRGTVDMQDALFEHASRSRSRLKRTSKVIDNLESRVYNDEFIEELDAKSLLKLLILARESELETVGFLERLYKLAQDSQRVIKVTQTLSMSGVSGRGSSIEDSDDIDKPKLEEIRSLLMQVISSNDAAEKEKNTED